MYWEEDAEGVFNLKKLIKRKKAYIFKLLKNGKGQRAVQMSNRVFHGVYGV